VVALRSAPVKITALSLRALNPLLQTCDGVRLAYAKIGDGPKLVTVGHWMTHMHYGWENAIRRGAWQRLSGGRQHIFYDWRGCGLSDRNVGEITHDIWVSDLEAVVEASGADRFALFGASASASVAITYAARHRSGLSTRPVWWLCRGRLLWPATDPDRRKQSSCSRAWVGSGQSGFSPDFHNRIHAGATKEQFDAFTESGRK
jgi:pimeloyl-ACP methyl ester carboxylesterase